MIGICSRRKKDRPAALRSSRPTWGGATALRGVLTAVLALGIVATPLAPPAAALDPIGAPPASFSRPASAARAATIMLLAPDGADETAALEPADRFLALRERALGSGVIVDSAGLALTSARLVRLMPEFEVVSGDGTPLKASVLAVDARSDVAVLKLNGERQPFPALPFGDSDQVQPGDWVIAVGAPFGLVATVTAGVITATPARASDDPFRSLLQTDAVAGYGYAGAPIVNLRGEMVGLTTVLGGDDIGYAVPSRVARRVYLELLEKGRVSRPWLGVTTQSLSADLARALGAPDAAGVVITDALPGGPAARAGLRSGDIVLRLDAVPISSRAQLERAVSGLEPGRTAILAVRRARRVVRVSVVLAEEPSDASRAPGLVRADELLGIEASAITPTMGVAVATIDPGGPAASAGVEPGDVIREIDRRPIRSLAEFEAAVGPLRPGAPALMLVQRGTVALYVVVIARP